MWNTISIHAPAKGATRIKSPAVRSCDFNPRSREGSDTEKENQGGKNNISIHAPAKGATRIVMDDAMEFNISIHAPAKGATECSRRKNWKRHISIHAPAKGATHKHFTINLSILFQSTLPRRERPNISQTGEFRMYFNPRSREGSDGASRISRHDQAQFQSTLPRRERREKMKSRTSLMIFQSTLPRRERP